MAAGIRKKEAHLQVFQSRTIQGNVLGLLLHQRSSIAVNVGGDILNELNPTQAEHRPASSEGTSLICICSKNDLCIISVLEGDK